MFTLTIDTAEMSSTSARPAEHVMAMIDAALVRAGIRTAEC
jgi:hypothetical protein